MARLSKKEQRLKTYGDVQQTVPLLMPEKRYRALKILAQMKGKTLNKFLRDVIEDSYRDELDSIEDGLSSSSDQHESAEDSFKASARLAS